MSLRVVKYSCSRCRRIRAFRFLKSYVPYRRWWFTCGCGAYAAHLALSRPVSGRYR